MVRKPDIKYINFYTDGSAAKKLAPVYPGAKPERKPRIKQKKKVVLHIDVIAVAGIAVAVTMLILMAVGIGKYNTSKEQMMTLEQYVVSLQEKNAQLEKDYKQGYNLAEVEKMALALGMVPKEQATQIPIEVSVPQILETPNAWDRMLTFLMGLFA